LPHGAVRVARVGWEKTLPILLSVVLPIDLSRILKVNKPVANVTYE
jgi:hypothetical protein